MKSIRTKMLMLFLLFSTVLASQTLFAEAGGNFELENKFIAGEEVVILFTDYENLRVNALRPKPSSTIKNIIYYRNEEKDFIIKFIKNQSSLDVKNIRKNNYTNTGRSTIRAPNILARRKTC